MQPLNRRLGIALLAALLPLALAASAQARVVEIGRAGGVSAASCPGDPCRALSRTTGYQNQSGSSKASYRVPAAGRLVAWTVALSSPNARQVAFFDGTFGAPSAGITVLRLGKKKLQRFNVAQGPIVALAPYFGQEAQFPLETTLAVKKGDIVALSVPTWAPVLTQLLNDGTSWMASRPRGRCDDTDTQTAHTKLGPTRYRCKYAARLTYSATLVTTPQPNAG